MSRSFFAVTVAAEHSDAVPNVARAIADAINEHVLGVILICLLLDAEGAFPSRLGRAHILSVCGAPQACSAVLFMRRRGICCPKERMNAEHRTSNVQHRIKSRCPRVSF